MRFPMPNSRRPGGRGPLWKALLAAMALLWGVSGCQFIVRPTADQEAETLPSSPWRIATSWGAAPLVEELLRAYQTQGHGANAEVIPCGDRRAEEMLTSGEAEMAFVMRPAPLATGRGNASEQVREIPLAYGGLALIVHPSMPLAQIAPEDLAALYEGFIVDWSTLGGSAGPPEIISRPEGDIAREIFERAVMPGRPLTSAALLLPHDQAVLDYVSTHPLAIGYVAHALVDERVKVISLGGFLPSVHTLEQGRYPLTFTLALLTRAETPAEATRFASFVRGSRAQRIIAERYVPAR